MGHPKISGVPTFVDLCHPILSHVPFTRDGWLFELKHDGFRAPARTGRTGVQLLSRSGRSMMADPFPEIVAGLAHLPDGLVLDGELVVPSADGRSDFEELRRRNLLQRPRVMAEAAAMSPAVLIIFDLLEVVGEDLRALPLLDRSRGAGRARSAGTAAALIQHVETHGEALFHAIAAQDVEGIVASAYTRPIAPADSLLG